MPELPEVETVRRGLERAMKGAAIESVQLRRPDLRRPLPERFARRLQNVQIRHVGRRAKYLVVELDSGESLIMHLGMSGSFRIEQKGHEGDPLGPHDHVVFTLSSDTRVIYTDPRRFGSMDLVTTAQIEDVPPLKGIGLEPLGDDLTADWLAKQLAGRSTPIKAALLDQRMIAGLGNIYVCEALWRAEISPLRQASTLATKAGRPTAACQRLPSAIKAVLNEAIASGGSSLRNHFQTDGTLGTFQHSFDVYGREGGPCHRPGCTGEIRRIVQSGRSTFFCPTCQK